MPGDIIVKFFATFFLWFLFLGLGVLWVIDGKIKKEQVAHALLSCLIAFVVSLFIKELFPTIRPFMLNGGGVDVIIPPTNGGFPSEHTTIAFALSVTVFLHERKVGWYFLVSALMIGAARVLANVHYPIDIIGGGILGTIAALAVERVHLFNLLTKRKK